MMDWDEDFQHFIEFGADNPEYIDWDAVFPSAAYIVEIAAEDLQGLINENSVPLDEATILADMDQDKMDLLDEHIAGGGACSPPWGIVDNCGQLNISQGKHRFQRALLMNENPVSIVVNEKDKNSLVRAGVAVSFRKMFNR